MRSRQAAVGRLRRLLDGDAHVQRRQLGPVRREQHRHEDDLAELRRRRRRHAGGDAGPVSDDRSERQPVRPLLQPGHRRLRHLHHSVGDQLPVLRARRPLGVVRGDREYPQGEPGQPWTAGDVHGRHERQLWARRAMRGHRLPVLRGRRDRSLHQRVGSDVRDALRPGRRRHPRRLQSRRLSGQHGHRLRRDDGRLTPGPIHEREPLQGARELTAARHLLDQPDRHPDRARHLPEHPDGDGMPGREPHHRAALAHHPVEHAGLDRHRRPGAGRRRVQHGEQLHGVDAGRAPRVSGRRLRDGQRRHAPDHGQRRLDLPAGTPDARDGHQCLHQRQPVHGLPAGLPLRESRRDVEPVRVERRTGLLPSERGRHRPHRRRWRPPLQTCSRSATVVPGWFRRARRSTSTLEALLRSPTAARPAPSRARCLRRRRASAPASASTSPATYPATRTPPSR